MSFSAFFFGLVPATRIFTKVWKAVLHYLREAFLMLIVGYIDDFFTQAKDFDTCLLQMVLVFHIIGFEVNFLEVFFEVWSI